MWFIDTINGFYDFVYGELKSRLLLRTNPKNMDETIVEAVKYLKPNKEKCKNSIGLMSNLSAYANFCSHVGKSVRYIK